MRLAGVLRESPHEDGVAWLAMTSVRLAGATGENGGYSYIYSALLSGRHLMVILPTEWRLVT